ncbi:hypothetical protein CVT24_006017 [Panaeolus cyanescens]|uniref:Uncharacterized protein n=1 Tax=Panaeolus cyanescens TaxID=181874 RepID=A0A409YE23_9AGAR|nr:hypothetical protein CVT24_006017 [Panaeolus cyanescens]
MKTNSERLAARLPPLTPARLFNPSVHVARQASPTLYSGTVRIRDAESDEALGWISKHEFEDVPVVTTTTNIDEKVIVEFNDTTPDSAFGLHIIGDDVSLKWIGVVGVDFPMTNASVSSVLRTYPVPAGSPAQPQTFPSGFYTHVESHIWTFDLPKRELTATWVNSDYSSVPLYFYVAKDANLLFVANVAQAPYPRLTRVYIFLDQL